MAETRQTKAVGYDPTFKRNQIEQRRDRMAAYAERLLEEILRRARWSARDRDRIAEYIDGVVGNEVALAAGKRGGQ